MASSRDAVHKEMESAVEQMQSLANDNTVPRNIRSVVQGAASKLSHNAEDKGVAIGSAIYALEDISNDINMPSHTRTDLWAIISMLEAIREKLNKQ